MDLEKAFQLMNDFSWLEEYLRTFAAGPEKKDKGWLTAWLRGRVRYIAPRPIEKLNLSRTYASLYWYRVPDPAVGVEKPVNLMAFCITSPICFKLRTPASAPRL